MTAVRAMLLTMAALLASGCQAIGAIFEAGMWVGMIAVVLVVAVAFALVAAIRRPRPPAP